MAWVGSRRDFLKMTGKATVATTVAAAATIFLPEGFKTAETAEAADSQWHIQLMLDFPRVYRFTHLTPEDYTFYARMTLSNIAHDIERSQISTDFLDNFSVQFEDGTHRHVRGGNEDEDQIAAQFDSILGEIPMEHKGEGKLVKNIHSEGSSEAEQINFMDDEGQTTDQILELLDALEGDEFRNHMNGISEGGMLTKDAAIEELREVLSQVDIGDLDVYGQHSLQLLNPNYHRIDPRERFDSHYRQEFSIDPGADFRITIRRDFRTDAGEAYEGDERYDCTTSFIVERGNERYLLEFERARDGMKVEAYLDQEVMIHQLFQNLTSYDSGMPNMLHLLEPELVDMRA